MNDLSGKGENFEYEDWMFSRMEEKNQKEFLTDYSLSVGLYYVHAIMPYDRAANGG